MRHLMMLTVVIVTCCLAHAQENASAHLSLATSEGCYLSGEGAGLWSALLGGPEAGAIHLEAEEATNLELAPGVEVREDERCGGGQCVQRVTQADFVFTVAPGKGGTYQGWAHIFLPRPGSWNHMESMDDGKQRRVQDSAAWTFGQWIWSKLGSYGLGAGEHTFTLHGFLGGARIDTIIFSAKPDFDPTHLRGAPGLDDTGSIITRSVLPSGVERWGRLAVDADLNGGTLGVAVSADGGQSWRAAKADGMLTDVAVERDGTDSLMTRLTLTAAADGTSPLVRGVEVDWVPDPDAEIALENEHYRIALARHTGALAGIYNKTAGVWATSPHVQSHFLGLAVREAGGATETIIAPGEMRFEGANADGEHLMANYSALDGGVLVRVDMSADATPLANLQISVVNNSALEVTRVDFPLIGGAAIGDYINDECVLPRAGGWRLKTAEMTKPWMMTYMGGGAMNWMDVCDPEAGLYVMCMDPELTTSEIEAAPAAGHRAADLAMRTRTLIAPGQTRMRQYVIGVHEGDWHWAADRYREWAYTWMRHPDDPEWVKWIDGWAGAMSTPFAHMTDYLRDARAGGFDYLQYWGQMTDGIDQCCGNFYWPAPALGGSEGFRQGIAAVHAAGGKVTGYMNCQTWTHDAFESEFLRLTPRVDLPAEALNLLHGLDWFEKWRLHRIDGSAQPYRNWHIMCPASDGFREHLRFWMVDMYAERFGADGVYLDQAGATLAKPCYNLGHGHDDIGGWGMGNLKLFETVIEQARAINPDFILSIEGAADALGQYASLHLISGMCTHPEVYHYTFPDHILISGVSNNSTLTGPQRTTRAFINGDRFDARVGASDVISAVMLRQRVKRWLYPGRFMDTVGLTVTDDRALARWAVCNEPGERAIVLSFENEQLVENVEATLSLPENMQTPPMVYVFDREGNVWPEAPMIEDGALTVAVPLSSISTALVLYETAAPNTVDVWQTYPEEPMLGGNILLRAVNLGAENLAATLRVNGAPPLELPEQEFALDLPAGGAREIELALSGAEQCQQPTPLSLELSWAGGSRTRNALVRPLLLNAGMDLDDDGDSVPDYWRRSGTKNTFATGFEEGGAWIQGDEKEYQFLIQPVPLKPETEYYFAGRVKRSEPTKQVSIAVVESVGERGIVMHWLANDETLPAGEWQRFETTFTTKAQFRACNVYLYCTNTAARAWFDDLELRATE